MNGSPSLLSNTFASALAARTPSFPLDAKELELLESRRKHFVSDYYERNRLEFYRRKIFTHPMGSLLDLGSNSGEFVRPFGHLARRIVALDYQFSLARIARANLSGEFPASSLCGNVTHLPFSDGVFDSVLMFELIEHLPKEQHKLCLAEGWRVLRPGGNMFVSTPNNASITAMTGRRAARQTGIAWNAWDSTHLYLYRSSEFLEALRQLRPTSVTRHAYYFLPEQLPRTSGTRATRLLHRVSMWTSLHLSSWEPFFSLGFNTLIKLEKPA